MAAMCGLLKPIGERLDGGPARARLALAPATPAEAPHGGAPAPRSQLCGGPPPTPPPSPARLLRRARRALDDLALLIEALNEPTSAVIQTLEAGYHGTRAVRALRAFIDAAAELGGNDAVEHAEEAEEDAAEAACLVAETVADLPSDDARERLRIAAERLARAYWRIGRCERWLRQRARERGR